MIAIGVSKSGHYYRVEAPGFVSFYAPPVYSLTLEALITRVNKCYETTKPENFDEFFSIREGIKAIRKRFEVK